MRIWIFACCFLALGVSRSDADLTITQKIEGIGQSSEVTSRFKDGKTRVDAAPGTSIILDLKTGNMISLNHPQKTYLKVAGETTLVALESAKSLREDHPDPKPALTPTGRKEKIGEFAAEEYTYTMTGVKIALWLTKELPDYQAALTQMSSEFNQGVMAAMGQNYDLDIRTLPGFPIRTVIEVPPGQTMTRTVVAVSTKPVPETEFQVPADYHEIAIQTLTPPAANALPTP